MNKMRSRMRFIALANLLLAGCWGMSCSTDLRDAAWAGVMDYVTGTTTETLSCTFSADGCLAAEE